MDSESSPSAGFYNFLGWLELNKKRLLVGAGIAAVLAVIITAMIQHAAQKETRASHALSDVRTSFPPGPGLPPGAVASYAKVAQDYPGTKAAARALLYAGGAFFAENKFAEAQTQFERLLREYPESPWVGSATFGLASALAAQQKTNEAMAKFEEFRRRYPNDPSSDEVKLSLGRLYEGQNKNEEALKLYDEVTKANPYSGLGAEAGMRQMDLLQKYPHLAKTNPPPVSALPPAVAPIPTAKVATNNFATTMSNIVKRAATNLASQTVTNKAASNTAPLLLKPGAPGGKP